MKNFFQQHWSAIFFSAVAGLIIIAPQLVFIYHLGNSYQGIYPLETDAETHYVARMREFYDGHFTGNPFLAEYKNITDSPFFTPIEAIISVPGKLLNIPAARLNLLYKFIFPGFAFFFCYWLLWQMTRGKLAGITAGTLVLFGYQILTMPGIIKLLHWEYAYNQFLFYNRPINPEVSGTIFLLFLNILYSCWIKPSTKKFFITALLLGISFYTYLYLWTFLLTLLVASLLGAWLIKKPWRGYLVSMFGGIVLGAPVLWFLFLIRSKSSFETLGSAFDLSYSRMPSISILGIMVLGFLVFFGKTLTKEFKYFLWLLGAATLIVLNQNIITGIILQPGHYHWYFNAPIYSIILIVGIEAWVKRPWPKRTIFGIIIIICLCNAYLVQASSYYYWRDAYENIENISPVFQWLESHSAKDSVVLADSQISALIPIYTPDNVYWNTYSVFYLVPRDTVERRLFFYAKLLNIADLFTGQSSPEFKEVFESFAGSGISLTAKLNQDYRSYLANFTSQFPKDRLDYILVDHTNNHWNLTGLKVKETFHSGPYSLYQVVQSF